MGLHQFLATAFVASSLAMPANAAAPKPDYAFRNRIVDISVTLDPSVKANPALSADSLKEGRAWAAKCRAEAKAGTRETPAAFPPGRPWTYTRTYQVRSVVAGRYLSVVRSDDMDTNAAHPNTNVDTILWDDMLKKRISIRPFFAETEDGGPTLRAMLAAVIEAVKTEKKVRGVDDYSGVDWYKELKPSLPKIGAIALTPSTEPGKSAGLTFHYPPYAVGPYAEGGYVAFVPWQTLKPFLSPEGVAIFDGARPKGDADANND